MLRDRAKGRRDYRPTLDGRLEPRMVLSGAYAKQYSGGTFQGQFHFQTAYGGQAVQIRTPDGGVFVASLTNLAGTIAGAGAIHARAVPGDPLHRVDLYVSNSSSQTVLTIDTRSQGFFRSSAHTFNDLTGGQPPMLNIRNINITSRRNQPTMIGQILGYHSANLSGAINVTSASAVDRIAFNSIQPGARVSIAGDLNTLDVVTDINLGAGDYIHIGRDLNASQINGNINVANGGQFTIGRDTGGVVQPLKGSEPAFPSPVALTQAVGSLSSTTLFITNVLGGNLTVSPGGLFSIGRRPQNQLLIHGAINLNGGTLSANGVQGLPGLMQFILFQVPGTGTSATNPALFYSQGTGTILIEGGVTQNGTLIFPGQSPLAVSTTAIVNTSNSSSGTNTTTTTNSGTTTSTTTT